MILVGVFEAKWVSYRTDEAGVVPGLTQSLDELITGFNREVTAVTLCAEERDVICQGERADDIIKGELIWISSESSVWSACGTFLAVRLAILHVEEAVSKGFAAGRAHEAGGVPRLPQSVHHFL